MDTEAQRGDRICPRQMWQHEGSNLEGNEVQQIPQGWPGAGSLGGVALVATSCQKQHRKARARGLGPLQGKE